jgi:hypothetical protein
MMPVARSGFFRLAPWFRMLHAIPDGIRRRSDRITHRAELGIDDLPVIAIAGKHGSQPEIAGV